MSTEKNAPVKGEVPIYCQCCGSKLMAVIKDGVLEIQKRGHVVRLPQDTTNAIAVDKLALCES